jgi:hypothetical protein
MRVSYLLDKKPRGNEKVFSYGGEPCGNYSRVPFNSCVKAQNSMKVALIQGRESGKLRRAFLTEKCSLFIRFNCCGN